jgi:hypothetical protein
LPGLVGILVTYSLLSGKFVFEPNLQPGNRRLSLRRSIYRKKRRAMESQGG